MQPTTEAHTQAAPTDSYYRRLNVDRAASRKDIVRSYRRLALGVHPDAHPDDPGASARFRELTEAYDVLSDPVRRAAYDRRSSGSRVRIEVRHGSSRARPPKPVVRDDPDPAALPEDAVFRVGPVYVEAPVDPEWGPERRSLGTDEALRRAFYRWWIR